MNFTPKRLKTLREINGEGVGFPTSYNIAREMEKRGYVIWLGPLLGRWDLTHKGRALLDSWIRSLSENEK